ncbi:hypothetical protein HYW53_03010 [Candidatus Giovannonibacteria bacterium]|nr:hypothetical protein [Candidatus Giovannonibacteria bacterium]
MNKEDFLVVNMENVLGVVLAGGSGTRLWPLTSERAKPALFFGAKYRLVDFQLSNLINSWCSRIFLAVQYRPQSLMRHVGDAFGGTLGHQRGHFIRHLTPPLHEANGFFQSDADSLLQLRRYFEDENPAVVIIAMGDQIVKCDYRQMVLKLFQSGACALLVYKAVPVNEAKNNFGVLELDRHGNVADLIEKPEKPLELADRPGYCLANLAMYVIRSEEFFGMLGYLEKLRAKDPAQKLSSAGLQWLIHHEKSLIGYNLVDNEYPGMTAQGRGYWRDVGTLESWYAAQMEVCRRNPIFDMFSEKWPLFGVTQAAAFPTKADNITCNEVLSFGSIFQDNIFVSHSVISRCIIGAGSFITNSVLFDGVEVGAGSTLDRVIIEKNLHIPLGSKLTPERPPPGTVALEQAKEIKGTVPDMPVLLTKDLLYFPRKYQF